MSIVKGVFSIECSNCDKQREFMPDDADFHASDVVGEFMGLMTGYMWRKSFECEKCGREIEIKSLVYEYPAGVFYNDDTDIKGGMETSRFDYNLKSRYEHDGLNAKD